MSLTDFCFDSDKKEKSREKSKDAVAYSHLYSLALKFLLYC